MIIVLDSLDRPNPFKKKAPPVTTGFGTSTSEAGALATKAVDNSAFKQVKETESPPETSVAFQEPQKSSSKRKKLRRSK